MIVQVKLFAVARQVAGRDTVAVEVACPVTIGGLRAALSRQVPDLDELLRGVVFAVNADYASDEMEVGEHDEVACIPPVSGG